MTDIQNGPNRLPWPPIIYLAAIAISIALGLLFPLPWISAPLSDILFAAGWLLVAAMVALDFSAMRTMARAKTTIMPNRASEHLVTTGAFSFTRNPIYLGNTLLMIGVGLITGIAWFLPLAIVAAFLTQKLAIEREERHLEGRFGKRYRDYAKRVRRWI
ncbi:methyltransferase family protein [Allomesorhizobium camelthorni]|uniref:Isoprenylcysteine carboxylmethyltransferase family protein n=1 Tax=Allomesorhizobium camelthorni TaxID=475069 RepID=A0A6G4W8B0_9HYPH|nr:isoprenylcysteine carboxylmethyltransferase family protein [Mesorhizobium camelthorni]NGO50387.1 isoprenylcysteine carboxylmethyltransferase family protein [Mesorhizobium camelthorni]